MTQLSATDIEQQAPDSPPKELTVPVGENVVFAMAANATTGYRWSCGVIAGSEFVQVEGMEYIPDRPVRAGSGGRTEITLRGLGAGKAVLGLIYGRPSDYRDDSGRYFTLVDVVA